MAEQTSASSNLYALLIGIDYYLPNELGYTSLNGCVRDISRLEKFLKGRLGMPKENILKLTSTNSGGTEPSEPRDQWPTYEKIVNEFKRLTAMAKPGDQVYIHYSGHGGRTLTLLPKVKGQDGVDEAIVPMNIGEPGGRYLCDHELTKLIDDMVKKKLMVTVVLDSCNSGGIPRGINDVRVRGLNTIDKTPRPTDSLVASHEELAETWQRLTKDAKRNVALGSGWLPEPKDYVLLAACRPSEGAHEYINENMEWTGALTYWLLDSLQDIGPGLSYKMVHDRVLAKVHSRFSDQTPLLMGEGDRAVFGSNRVQPHYAVTVLKVEPDDRLMLQAGQVNLLDKGAQLAIYPRGTTDFTNAAKRQALVEISELGAAESWAKITKKFGQAPIEQGAQAVLIGASATKLVRKVRLLDRNQPALQAIEKALAGIGWVEVAGDQEPVEYHVSANANNEYEIGDRSGKPIENLRPAIKTSDRNAAASVVQRLIHLTKHHAVKQLHNHDALSPLARKLVVELIGRQKDYDPADKPAPKPFDDPGPPPTVAAGEWAFLRIKNMLPKPDLDEDPSKNVLNITVLDLQPDWGITQVYPLGASDYFVALDPEQELIIPLRGDLPSGYTEGADTLKIFATVGSANFRWLALPALDQPLQRKGATRGKPGNPLEELLEAIASEQPHTRNLIPAAFPSKEWVTAEVEVRVEK